MIFVGSILSRLLEGDLLDSKWRQTPSLFLGRANFSWFGFWILLWSRRLLNVNILLVFIFEDLYLNCFQFAFKSILLFLSLNVYLAEQPQIMLLSLVVQYIFWCTWKREPFWREHWSWCSCREATLRRDWQWILFSWRSSQKSRIAVTFSDSHR